MRKEIAAARDDRRQIFHRFLMDLGFAELVYQVTMACVMYPRSIDACRDCVNDLSHSLYQTTGKSRLTHEDQERLTRLIDFIGDEVIRILEPHGFYERSFDSLWSHYDDVVATVDMSRISNATFEVTVRETTDDNQHRELSDKSFGDLHVSHWSH